MTLHFRKPEFWPTVITGIAVVVLISLGCWQLQRLAWKEDIIRRIALGETEATLAALPKDEAELRALEFRKVKLQGRFLNEHEFHLTPRYQGRTFGYHVLTPFLLTDRRTVLVDRGFVPADKKAPATRPHSIIKERTTIRGMVRLPYPRALVLPDNRVQENLWFWFDLPAMQRTSGLSFPPIFIEALGKPDPELLPIPSDGLIALRNDHLMYAITWFGFALAALLIYGLYHRRKP